MNYPNNEGNRASIGYPLSPNEAPSTETGLYIMELLAEGVPGESPNNPGHCQDCRLLCTNWQLGSAVKDKTFTTHWMWSGAGAYIEPSPHVLVVLVQEGSPHATKGEIWTTQQHIFWSSKICKFNGSTKVVWVTNQKLTWLKAHSTKGDPHLTLLVWEIIRD